MDSQPQAPDPEPSAAALRACMFAPAGLEPEGVARALEEASLSVAGPFHQLQGFLDQVHAQPPQVVLIWAEDEEGPLSALSALRSVEPRVRSLVLSTGGAEGLASRCYAAGAAGFVDVRETGLAGVVAAVTSTAARGRLFPAQSLQLPSRSEPDERSQVLSRLSHREREVLAFLASGADNLKIAAHLGIRERTVKAHVSSLIRKLGRSNRTQLALLALELHVQPPSGI